ncbi:hypothetical protein COL154_013197 [Colletotrichum chrysophilum]|nr:hypothetical protein COL154_013197 [Colletotrichum chrysophilum]
MSVDKPFKSPKESIEAANIEDVSLEQEQAQEDKPHMLREVKKNKRVLMWSFQRQFGVEYHGVWTIRVPDQQLLNGANTIGILFSSGLNGIISDRFGRRYIFSFTVISLFGGKLLANVGIGLGWSLAPVFVAELAPESLRGFCLAILVIPPGLLLLISVVFLPESPSWLLMRGQEEKAMAALRIFKGDRPGIEEHLKAMKRAVDMEQAARVDQESSGWADVFRQPNLRRTMIATVAFCGQQWAGVTFVSGYLPYYFSLAGVNNALATAQGAYALQLIGNICSLFLVERTGRRPLMVGGSATISAGLLLIGLINITPNPASLKATVAFMTIWGIVVSKHGPTMLPILLHVLTLLLSNTRDGYKRVDLDERISADQPNLFNIFSGVAI